MNITDFSLKLNGYPIKKARRDLKEIQRISQVDYAAYISQKKAAILAYHLKNNPFYKNIITDQKTWEQLPVLTKRDLQIPLKKRLSVGFNLGDVYVNKTSGSTGDPFYFAKDKYTHALTWAFIEDRFNWHHLYGKKQARFYGLPKAFKPRIKERLKDVLANRYRFDVFDLSDTAFERWIRDFSKNSYRYLNGYTTVILAFAKYLNKSSLVLKDICPSLHACVVTSEMCFDEDRILMELAFGLPIIKEYGASELDLIAFQNTKNEWVLNTETLFVEVLNERNHAVPYGTTGKIVITSLYNKAHPFIRYEIGDMGAITPLNNNKIILNTLQGRKEDIVQLPSGKQAPGLTFYYVTKAIMEDDGVINEIKVTQTTLASFKIEYASKQELSTPQKEKIQEALFNYLEPNLSIDFQRFDQLKRSKSGKLKQFTSLLK
jgi:phenylacetate-CoA ligase